jgi:hypothetical protein
MSPNEGRKSDADDKLLLETCHAIFGRQEEDVGQRDTSLSNVDCTVQLQIEAWLNNSLVDRCLCLDWLVTVAGVGHPEWPPNLHDQIAIFGVLILGKNLNTLPIVLVDPPIVWRRSEGKPNS